MMTDNETAKKRRQRVLSIANSVVRLVVIAALAVSGVGHLLQPYYYLQTVAAYDLIPTWMLFAFSFFVPSFQLALGFGMISNYIGKMAVYCALALFATFAMAQASVLWRGMDIDCGCFGVHSVQISRTSVLIPASLAMCCVFLLWANRHDPLGVADRSLPDAT